MVTTPNLGVALAMLAALAFARDATAASAHYYELHKGSGPHDVAAAPDPGGPVYYTAQRTGHLGVLDPKSGKVVEVALGKGSAPHGVIVGPDHAAWVTDGGQNAIVRFDPATESFDAFPSNRESANVRQMLGRAGEAWGAESGTDRLVVVR